MWISYLNGSRRLSYGFLQKEDLLQSHRTVKPFATGFCLLQKGPHPHNLVVLLRSLKFWGLRVWYGINLVDSVLRGPTRSELTLGWQSSFIQKRVTKVKGEQDPRHPSSHPFYFFSYFTPEILQNLLLVVVVSFTSLGRGGSPPHGLRRPSRTGRTGRTRNTHNPFGTQKTSEGKIFYT